MSHFGILGGTVVGESSEDIRGAHLYDLDDEKLGKIDDVIFDHTTGDIRYVVVDTGGWLSTKKFLVPVERIRASAKHNDDFEASLSKQQIESFPPYNESDLESENRWSGYETKYRAEWVNSPVMHRAETDRNVTPTTQQTTGNLESKRAAAIAHGQGPTPRMNPVSRASQADFEAASQPTERNVPAGSDSVVISSNADGIGGRWDTFQSRLRERRKEAVASCRTCTGESAMRRGSESVDTLRKAV